MKCAALERGKVPMHLLLMACTAEVARVLEHGNKKPGRGAFNWRRRAIRESDMIDGALRHIHVVAFAANVSEGTNAYGGWGMLHLEKGSCESVA